MTVFDTSVIADALLGATGVRGQALRALRHADEIVVPDLFFAELADVVRQYVRRAGLPLHDGLAILDDAEGLVTRSVPTIALWRRALELAVEKDHPAYDTLFIALAESEGTTLLTRDARLGRLFPDIARPA